MTDRLPDRSQLKPDPTLIDALVRARWFLLLIFGLIASVFLVVVDVPTPDLPVRAVKLFAITFLIALAIGFPVARRIVDYLYTPDTQYLLDYNAETDEFGVWAFSPNEWKKLEVEEDTHRLQAAEPVYEARNYNPETNRAEGTWRGSATDLELVEHREAVSEVRGDLEDLAKDGLSIRVKQSSIVRGAVQDVVMDFVADFESDTIYSGDQIQNRVQSAIDDLNDDPDDPDTPSTPPEQTNKITEAVEQRFGSSIPSPTQEDSNGQQ